MKNHIKTGACFFCFMISGIASANDVSNDTSDSSSGQVERKIKAESVFAVRSDAGDPSLGPLAPQIQARSDVIGDSIKLTFGTSVAEYDSFAEASFSASLTAPFNKKAGVGDFLTQAGLPGTLSLELAFSTSIIGIDKLSIQDEEMKLTGRLLRECQRQNTEPSENQSGRLPAICLGDIRVWASSNAPAELSKILEDMSREREDAIDNSSYLGLQINGSVGRDTFKYREDVTFTELKPNRTLYSFGTSMAYLPTIDSPIGFFVGGEYKRRFKLPDAEIRCPLPSASSVSTTCFESAFGPPKKEIDAAVFGALRLNGNLAKLPLSAELKVAYDAKDGEWGATMPVYFLRDKDGKLNGGIRLGYDGEKDKFSFGFFVGTTFDFLKF